MLPKKRKFDLSKFELDRDDEDGHGSGHQQERSGVSVTTVTSRGQERHPPPSTFLAPETVHDAFAGGSYLRSSSSQVSRTDNVVDLSRKPVTAAAQYSAFSRPSQPHQSRQKPLSNLLEPGRLKPLFTEPSQSFKGDSHLALEHPNKHKHKSSPSSTSLTRYKYHHLTHVLFVSI